MSRIPRKLAMPALGALACCLPPRMAQAQALQQVEQAQQVQRLREFQPAQASTSDDPSLYPGEEEDTGRQFLLRTVSLPHWNWISLSLDSQYYHTSNAFLTNTGKQGAGLLVSTIDAEVDAPPIAVPFGQLRARAGYLYQWFDYAIGDGPGTLSQLDFDAATTYLEADYDLPANWYAVANLSYTRLLNNGAGYDEFYKELVPSLRIGKTIQLRQDLIASVEYYGNYRFTDETATPDLARSSSNRTDQALNFALTWQFAKKMDLRPFYSVQYSHYPGYFAGQSRNDFLQTVGVYADYSINAWSSIRVFVSYEARDSDAASVPDYRKLDAGGGVSANFNF